jgi:hypothetical protein
MRHTLQVVTAVVIALGVMSASAMAACKDVTVTAKGAEMAGIEAATLSAGDALVAKVRQRYGAKWGVGSHRNGSFHCDKALAGRKPGWICSAKTTAICAP